MNAVPGQPISTRLLMALFAVTVVVAVVDAQWVLAVLLMVSLGVLAYIHFTPRSADRRPAARP